MEKYGFYNLLYRRKKRIMEYTIEIYESPKYLLHHINEKNYKHLCEYSIEIIKINDGKERKEDKIIFYDH